MIWSPGSSSVSGGSLFSLDEPAQLEVSVNSHSGMSLFVSSL